MDERRQSKRPDAIPWFFGALGFMRALLDRDRNAAGRRTDVAKTSQSLTKPTLDQLLAGVTPENCHGEIETGPPRGVEVW